MDNRWQEAHARVSQDIRRHPAFRQLVREVAVAEQPNYPHLWWLQLNSSTFGSWCQRGMPCRRRGRLDRRARMIADRIAGDLRLYPERPKEAEARVYVEARGFVQARRRGA